MHRTIGLTPMDCPVMLFLGQNRLNPGEDLSTIWSGGGLCNSEWSQYWHSVSLSISPWCTVWSGEGPCDLGRLSSESL